jgi:hypothetical protein
VQVSLLGIIRVPVVMAIMAVVAVLPVPLHQRMAVELGLV